MKPSFPTASGLRRRLDRGQAAVETALTLPLTIFLILGTLQLFMAQHGRIMAQLAAYKAVRSGTVRNASCKAMTHAAIATLLPSFTRVLKDPSGGTPGERMANAFRRRSRNVYQECDVRTSAACGTPSAGREAIVWVDARTNRDFSISGTGDDHDFDNLSAGGYVLIVRLTYFYPLTIPFADWVIHRLILAPAAASTFNALVIPAVETQNGAFQSTDANIVTELRDRRSRNHLALPIVVTAAMRMMTPPRGQQAGGITGSAFSCCPIDTPQT